MPRRDTGFEWDDSNTTRSVTPTPWATQNDNGRVSVPGGRRDDIPVTDPSGGPPYPAPDGYEWYTGPLGRWRLRPIKKEETTGTPTPGGGGTELRSATTSYKFTPINAAQYGTPDWSRMGEYYNWWKNQPEYKEALGNITSIYDTYGKTGANAYRQAVDYWSSILRGGAAARTALAPAMGQLSEQADAVRMGLGRNAALTEPQRAEQLANLGQEYYKQSAGAIMSQAPAAAQQLGQLGMQGGQLGAEAMYKGAELVQQTLMAAMQGEQFDRGVMAQLAQANEQLKLGYNQLNANLIMHADSLNVQKEIAYAQIGLQREALEQQLTMFREEMAFGREQWDWQKNVYWPMQLQMAAAQNKAAQDAAKSNKWGSIFGGALGIGAAAIFSSKGAKTNKTNITPAMFGGQLQANTPAGFWGGMYSSKGLKRAVAPLVYTKEAKAAVLHAADTLSASEKIAKLRPVSWTYKSNAGPELEGVRGHGFIAQDVKKVIPEAVAKKKLPSGRSALALDLSALLATTALAIKDLHHRVEKVEKNVPVRG